MSDTVSYIFHLHRDDSLTTSREQAGLWRERHLSGPEPLAKKAYDQAPKSRQSGPG
jgi:hypothetical protein